MIKLTASPTEHCEAEHEYLCVNMLRRVSDGELTFTHCEHPTPTHITLEGQGTRTVMYLSRHPANMCELECVSVESQNRRGAHLHDTGKGQRACQPQRV